MEILHSHTKPLIFCTGLITLLINVPAAKKNNSCDLMKDMFAIDPQCKKGDLISYKWHLVCIGFHQLIISSITCNHYEYDVSMHISILVFMLFNYNEYALSCHGKNDAHLYVLSFANKLLIGMKTQNNASGFPFTKIIAT